MKQVIILLNEGKHRHEVIRYTNEETNLRLSTPASAAAALPLSFFLLGPRLEWGKEETLGRLINVFVEDIRNGFGLILFGLGFAGPVKEFNKFSFIMNYKY